MKHIRVQDEPVVSTPLPNLASWADYAVILHADGLGGAVGSEVFDPDFSIIEQTAATGAFSIPGLGEVVTPVSGLWAWSMQIYWSQTPTISGTDGVSYGMWNWQVDGDGATHTDALSGTPFFKSGSSPTALRYFSTAGLITTMDNSPPMSVYVSAGPYFHSYASVSGNSYWDIDFTLVRVSSLTEDTPIPS